MINELVKRIAAGLSNGDTPQQAALDAELQVRAEYGGERIYIPSLPKQRRSVQLKSLTQCRTQIQKASALGITVRGVRKILRGR